MTWGELKIEASRLNVQNWEQVMVNGWRLERRAQGGSAQLNLFLDAADEETKENLEAQLKQLKKELAEIDA